MFIPRLLTALALLAVLVPAIGMSSPWPLLGLLALMLGAAAWEWGRLAGWASKGGSLILGLLVPASAAVATSLWGMGEGFQWFWWTVSVLWLLMIILGLRQGPAAWSGTPRSWRSILAFVALVPAALAMFQARQTGVNFLLSIFALVWAADIFAYAAGKAMGRRLLAPSISPGKTWEGVSGGALGVCLVAALWIYLDGLGHFDSPSLYTEMFGKYPLPVFIALLGILVCFSVCGDLLESLMKRSAGYKDSSQLLPGHGGVLDRIDALLPVFPLALALAGR